MNTLTSTMDLKHLKDFFKRIDLLDYLFYLVILTFYIGKAFKPAVFLVDLVFLIEVYKKRDFWQRVKYYKSFIVALVLFACYLMIQGMFFVDFRSEVLRSTFEEIMYMIMVVAAIYHFQNFQQLKRLIFVTWFSVSLVLLDALYQYFTGHDVFGYGFTTGGHRLSAWRGDKSVLGPILGFFGGILFVTPFLLKEKKWKIVGWIIAILLVVVIVLAGNRSPILAFFSAIFFVIIISKYRKYLIALLSVLLVTFFLVLKTNPYLSDKYEALLHPTTNSATSNRYHIFLTVLEVIKEHPWMGIGPGAYEKYHLEATKKVDWKKYKQYQVEYFMKNAPTHAHSVFLDMILSYGLIGFGFLLYMLYHFFKQFVFVNEYTKLASLGLFYCITPFAFSRAFTVDTWQYMTYLSMVFVIVVAKSKESY